MLAIEMRGPTYQINKLMAIMPISWMTHLRLKKLMMLRTIPI